MILKLGSFGLEVEQLQKNLNTLGSHLVVDGQFGSNTQLAVKGFQIDNGLLVDGVVGPQTSSAILAALVGKPTNPVSNQITHLIDLYHGDDLKSWSSISNSNIAGCWLKATEGSNYVDPAFANRWETIKSSSLIRGAYHFYHPGQNPLMQAQLFCKTVGALDIGDLPCSLDWEVTDGAAINKDKADVHIFLDEVEKKTGKTPIIYGGFYFLNDLVLDKSFARYPLWVARYSSQPPMIPAPWTSYTFWQYTESAQITGVSNPCDVNLFNGSLSDLKNFIAASKV